MQVTVANVVEGIKRRLAALPRRRYLIAAAVLVGLMALGELLGGPEVLREVCDQIVADLGQIQPLGMVSHYFGHLAGCDTTSGYAGDYLNCSPWRFIDPRRFFGSLLLTLADTWSESGVPGRIILPLALIAAFPVMIVAVWEQARKRFGGLTDLVTLCVAALLTPLAASLIALVLQILAMVLFAAFGATLGLIAWLSTVFGGVWSIWKVAKEIRESAEKMEHIAGAVASVAAVRPANPDTSIHPQGH